MLATPRHDGTTLFFVYGVTKDAPTTSVFYVTGWMCGLFVLLALLVRFYFIFYFCRFFLQTHRRYIHIRECNRRGTLLRGAAF